MKTKNKEFFVYVDKTDSGDVFYVGKGNATRIKGTLRNKKHRRISEKFGLVREIVWSTESEAEAYAHERQLIEFFGTYTTDWGDLTVACNFTVGGEGCTRMRWNSKQRAKHRERIAAFKDDPGWRAKCSRAGKKNTQPKSPKHRQMIREAFVGKNLSPDHRSSISQGLLRSWAKRKEMT